MQGIPESHIFIGLDLMTHFQGFASTGKHLSFFSVLRLLFSSCWKIDFLQYVSNV